MAPGIAARDFKGGSEGAQGAGDESDEEQFRLCIQTLFSYAKSQRCLPTDWNEMEAVPLWKVKEEEVEIFTPDEMTLLLALAPANLVPFLTIGAFAGLRSAEIERLDWGKVDLESGYITVDASIAKHDSPKMRVFFWGGNWFSPGNQRLQLMKFSDVMTEGQPHRRAPDYLMMRSGFRWSVVINFEYEGDRDDYRCFEAHCDTVRRQPTWVCSS